MVVVYVLLSGHSEVSFDKEAPIFRTSAYPSRSFPRASTAAQSMELETATVGYLRDRLENSGSLWTFGYPRRAPFS